MSKQEEISDAEWAQAKQRGADAVNVMDRGLSKDEARERGSLLADQAYGRGGEERQAFYTGYMEKLGF